MSVKSRGGMGGNETHSGQGNYLPRRLAIFLCIACFCAGMFFTNRVWMIPEGEDVASPSASNSRSISMNHELKQVEQHESNHAPGEFSLKDNGMQTLERTISKLELELAAARVAQEAILNGSSASESLKIAEFTTKRKYLMVIGINTAFSSRKRRNSVRATWMAQGDKRKKLEEEKGIVIRFVIGHRHVLHKYANEDVSLGSWLIGLDVLYIDDKRLCCGTPPDCEWKAQAGNICVASFDWTCSGICRSDERIHEVHQRCGEGENVIWNLTF